MVKITPSKGVQKKVKASRRYRINKTIEKFIPPELRDKVKVIGDGIESVVNSMKISDPADITFFAGEIVKNIAAGNIAPTIAAIGNTATAIANTAMDILPGGTGIKTVARLPAKKIKDLS